MITMKGKYNSAKIMLDDVDDATIKQVHNLLDHPAFEHTDIAIMPDCHAGAGSVVGFTMKMNDKIIPNVIGVDIGCGIEAYPIGSKRPDFDKLDKFIRENIPSGFDKRKDFALRDYEKGYYDKAFEYKLKTAIEKLGLNEQDVMHSIGSLGGGNHFMEVDEDEHGDYWFIVHTGSRNFGLQVATYHQKKAKELMREKFRGASAYYGLEYLPMDEGGSAYLEDMKIAQTYASLNRRTIVKFVVEKFFHADINDDNVVKSVHNYINFEDNVIRKGAISAHEGQRLIIPLNMRDGVIIGRGRGVSEWNYSAPHGAGRRMSRTEAKKKLSLDDYRRSMQGIWSSCINKHTLDEAPAAYKPAKTILENIGQTVDIELILKPVYNFKAGE